MGALGKIFNLKTQTTFEFHFSLCIKIPRTCSVSPVHLFSFSSQIACFKPKLNEISKVSKLRISPFSHSCVAKGSALLQFNLLEMHVPSPYSLWICSYGCLVTWVIVNLSFFFLSMTHHLIECF